ELDCGVLPDYGEGVISNRVADQVSRPARRLSKPVIVDPKGTNYAKYRGATVVKPTIHEVKLVLKDEFEDANALLEASRRLVNFLEGAALLITRGEEGMSLFREGFEA